MESSKESAHVYVSGNVQGVSFRYSTRRKSQELGLAGWVKNLPDGRVEALFEGDPEDVREIVHWCEYGPSHADVENVEAEYGRAQENLEGFEVR